MAKVSTSKVQKVGTALRNPTIQKILAWVLPIVFGWVLSKIDKSSANNKTKKK